MKGRGRALVAELIFVFLLLFGSCTGIAQLLDKSFLVVESVPVETELGLAYTARTLPVWLEMINQAEESIDIGCFYFSTKEGEPLELVIRALGAAAKRGVHVRILADSSMSQTYPEELDNLAALPNISVARISLYNHQGGVMHAKYMIVDRKRLFVGSQNFDWRALKHIHEIGFYFHSPALAITALQAFETDWSITTGEKVSFEDKEQTVSPANPCEIFLEGNERLRVFPSFSPLSSVPDSCATDETQILRLINSAREEICVQLLSYSPVSHGVYYSDLDQALRAAAARGVSVKLLVSNWNLDARRIPYLKSLAHIPNVEIKFTSIPSWSGGYIPYARVEHCKFMVVDSTRGWLGTANWSRSYFHYGRNLGIVFEGKPAAAPLRETFYKSWNSPYAESLDPCREYRPPRVGEQ